MVTADPRSSSASLPGDSTLAQLLGEYTDALEREAALRREVEALRGELERAHAAADEARRVNGQFVAHMSHEVRTPLNAIVGLTQQVLAGPLTDEQRELMGHVQASGELMAQMLGGILELAQLESGAGGLLRRPFALVEEVELAVAAVASFAAAQRVELCLAASEAAFVTVLGDAVRLREVVFNVVSNAVRHGGGDVEVRVEVARAGDEVGVAIEVRDHGPGIDPGVLPRLFSGTGVHGAGLGLGLPICARVCALMGGEIAAENHPEGGAVVRLRVRLGLVGPVPREVVDLRGRRIQVDTASPGLRRVLTDWLARWGAQVVEADGELVIADAGRPASGPAPVVALVPVGAAAQPSGAAVACVARPVVQGRLGAAIRAAWAAKPGRSAAAVEEPSPSRLRVLVAEDNPFNQRVIVGALRRLGYATDVVMDGRAAVEAVASKPYDLVLMDLMMPELDGVAATREICERWAVGERPRIVAITAQASAEDQAACLDAGMADFLTKPLVMERLAAVLEACPRRSE